MSTYSASLGKEIAVVWKSQEQIIGESNVVRDEHHAKNNQISLKEPNGQVIGFVDDTQLFVSGAFPVTRGPAPDEVHVQLFSVDDNILAERNVTIRP